MQYRSIAKCVNSYFLAFSKSFFSHSKGYFMIFQADLVILNSPIGSVFNALDYFFNHLIKELSDHWTESFFHFFFHVHI